MKKRVLKKIAILAAPIIWHKIRRSRHHWRSGHHGHHRWHRRPHHCSHKRRGIWL